MTSKRQQPKSHLKAAKILLVSGFVLIAISFVLNLLFLRPANFKQRYKAQQYEVCIKNYSVESCQKKFKK